MSITTNFSKKSKKESENSQNFHFLDIYVLFFIFLKLHRCNKIVVNKSFSHFIFLPDKKSEFLSVIFPLQIKKKKNPRSHSQILFLFVSYYFTLTEGSCSVLFLPYCILMFNQKMFYYFSLKMTISFRYIIFISSILLHHCNIWSVIDNDSQLLSCFIPRC